MTFKHLFIVFFGLITIPFMGQNTDNFKGETETLFNLKHTKLEVSFNIQKEELYGKAWLTVTPHFYSTNTLILDAKGMVIHNVSLNNSPLKFTYDNFKLHITLPKDVSQKNTITVFIDYTARPNKVLDKLTNTLSTEKGLYFINPSKTDKNKPTQIFTHGETEGSSCWFPTLDAPNQKTTQDLYITVPNKYKTLSNGTLVKATLKGANRTDYWKLDKPHAPYLVFMGVGEFDVIKDTFNNMPIAYYVNKKHAKNAKAIFGNTPEMMQFFSDKFGVTYPWDSYNQIVVNDFVSGAMENTTAVVHNESVLQTPGQLIDGNTAENTIAHELVHHWFGNLVTAESWANLTLNESFATYGEYLWQEYKYGKEAAEMYLFKNNDAYFNSQENGDPLVNYSYLESADLFNRVTYNKGAAVLHMLRRYLGDAAFFKGLKHYLTTYSFKKAEVHQFRLALEQVTGKDLNWFFNQWYFGKNYPDIEVSYDYNMLRNTVTVNVLQLQSEVFKFPLTIDFFEGNAVKRTAVFVDGKDASFTFNFKAQPKLIQLNADGALLCKINENKILSDYIFQLTHADNYQHRKEALLEVVKKQDDKKAFNAVVSALNDKAYEIRVLALEQIDLINKFAKKDAINKIIALAKNDTKTLVKAAAIETLGKLTDPELKPIFINGLESKSYAILGKSLIAMYYVDKDLALKKSATLPDEVKKILATPLTKIFIDSNVDSELPFIAKNIMSGMFLANNKAIKAIYETAFDKISKSNNVQAIVNLSDDMVVKGKQFKQFNFDKVVINLMRKLITEQQSTTNSNKEKNIAIIKDAMSRLIQ